MTRCTHLDTVDPDRPPNRTDACEDCLREGTTWVSLRVCKSCGHVGCCDSSPRKHARAHYEEVGHSIIGPVGTEHGGWLWCYADEAYVSRDGAVD